MFMNLLAGTNSILELSVWEWVIGSILIVASIVIILVVLLQEGRQANVGVISGAADSFMEKGAAKTLDEKLSKCTMRKLRCRKDKLFIQCHTKSGRIGI